MSPALPHDLDRLSGKSPRSADVRARSQSPARVIAANKGRPTMVACKHQRLGVSSSLISELQVTGGIRVSISAQGTR